MKKITAVVHDLSANSVVRTYPLVKVLERRFKVEVTGLVLGREVFPPYQGELDFRPVAPGGPSLKDKVRAIRSLISGIEGDIVYAFKPLPTSFGAALLEGLGRRRPLVLDIEDWDTEEFVRLPLGPLLRHVGGNLLRRNGLYDWATEQAAPLADRITVATAFLQRRYGGSRVPHGADAIKFDPALVDRAGVRARFGLEGRRVLLFAGTVREHKGMDDAVEALRIADVAGAVLLIVGAKTPEVELLLRSSPPGAVAYLPSQPHSAMPEIWSLADAVLLPQKGMRYAAAQVPAKVFEAMAMSLPVIASAVGDLPEILQGCGRLVPPGAPGPLAEAIREVLGDPGRAAEMGRGARERFLAHYSWDAMETVLAPLFDGLS